MTVHKTLQLLIKCSHKIHSQSDGLHWTPLEGIFVDQSFFYGYLLTQIPAGLFASYLPATKIFGTSVFLTSIFNLLIVTAMSYDSAVLTMMFRFFQGLVDVSIKKSFKTISMCLCLFFCLVQGCNISSLSWHLEILGSTIRAFTFGNVGILWIVCWSCHCFSTWQLPVGLH